MDDTPSDDVVYDDTESIIPHCWIVDGCDAMHTNTLLALVPTCMIVSSIDGNDDNTCAHTLSPHVGDRIRDGVDVYIMLVVVD
jgi:hypothetical protein